jgi:gamma-glutamylcyclotransferase (GGCT)/AIG2-like uncharacterized protein YtfP
MSEILNIFVYGTLKPGEVNHDFYCRERLPACLPAFVYGQLYDLPFGYPAMVTTSSGTNHNSSTVQGFVLSFTQPEVLAVLDELEDYSPARPVEQNEYRRVLVEAFLLDGNSLGQVWVYEMELPLIQKSGGILLPQGVWSGQK